jgi:hypothetical protein
MNEPERDEDFERALGQWSPSRPPSDFAEKVTSRFLQERPTVSRWPKGRVLVPLLLAALFLSAGAFAAWQEFRPRLSLVGDDALPAEKRSGTQETRVRLHQVHQSGQAEPERHKEPVAPQPPRKARKDVPAKVDEIPENKSSGPTPPKKLHLPDCECGTSAIVCSCSE